MHSRSAIFLVCLLLVVVACNGEPETPDETVAPVTEETLFPITEGDDWGYIDRSGEVVIQPRFEHAYRFVENRALVRVDGEYGYINPDGTFVIEPQFDDAWHFSDGQAPVQTGEEWSFIGPDGNQVRDARVDLNPQVLETRAVPPDAYRRVRVDGQYGYQNGDGELVIDPRFERAWHFTEGRARVMVDGQWGYIDTDGEIVVEPQFDRAWDFENGLALVSTDDGYAYIDRDGQFVWHSGQ